MKKLNFPIYFHAVITIAMLLFSCNHENKNLKDSTQIKIFDKAAIDSINKWNNRSYKLLNTDIDSSGYYAKKALELSERIKNDSTLAVAQVNIGFAFLQKKDTVKANDFIENAVKHFQLTDDKYGQASVYKIIGRNYRKINDYISSLNYYFKALNVYTSINDSQKIAELTIKKIAEIYLDLGLYDLAYDNLKKSLRISENINYKLGIADACINISYIYLENDSISCVKGKDFLLNALLKYKSFDDTVQFAKFYSNLGDCYASIIKYDSAIYYYIKAVDLYKKIGKGIDTRILDNIANSYDNNKQYDSSKKYFLMAYDSSMSLKNENRIGALFYLGSYYKDNKNFTKATTYFLECIKLGKEIFNDIENKRILRWAYSSLAKSYDSLKDYKSAYKYFMEYSKLNDFILNQVNSREIIKINLKYELDQQLKEKEKEKNKLILTIIYLIIGLSLLIILAFFIYRSYIIKKRANKKLLEKNDIISNQLIELETLNEILRIKNIAIIRQNEELETTYRMIQSDLQNAAKYVYSLMPQNIESHNIKTDWYFKPCSRLGGDAFGFHWIDEENFAIYLLDVCGHGVGAALHSVSILNMIKSRTLNIDLKQPKEVVKVLNDTYLMFDHNELYFTLWYGVYNINEKELEYICAGHPAPLLIENSGELLYLDTNNISVGVVPSWNFDSKKIKIKKNSTIHIFSDGVYEIKKLNGKMMYLDEFYDIIRNIHSSDENKTTENWASFIYDTMIEINNKEELEDDFSLLRVEIK